MTDKKHVVFAANLGKFKGDVMSLPWDAIDISMKPYTKGRCDQYEPEIVLVSSAALQPGSCHPIFNIFADKPCVVLVASGCILASGFAARVHRVFAEPIDYFDVVTAIHEFVSMN